MAAAQLKSILKKTPHLKSAQSKEERDRETAVYHATLLQQRKDIELEIVLNIEQLIDSPNSPSSTSDNPSAEDVRDFKALLRPFQPSDYDALIHERNINNHCGYALCPNPRAKDGSQGEYRIIGTNGKAKDFKIVPRAETEKWCSEICARRALYVRVQLSETPAWERVAVTTEIDLMDEAQMKTERKKHQELLAEDLSNLALAQGASTTHRNDQQLSSVTHGMAEISIQEKEITQPANPPSLIMDDLNGRLATTHLSLEGYRPNFDTHRRRRRDSSQSNGSGEPHNDNDTSDDRSADKSDLDVLF